MAGRHPSELPDELFEEAALWHARVREPGLTEADRQAFAVWLNRDPRHRQAYQETKRLWVALDEPVASLISSSSPPQPGGQVYANVAKEGSAQQTFRAGPLGPAPRRAWIAGLVLLISLGLWWQLGGLDTLRSDYVTGVGQRETVVLSDGSQLVCNTNTAVAVDLTAAQRTVRLFRGEAFFRIVSDPSRPFIVQTAEGQARVVGTEFNVRKTEAAMVISVVQGQLELMPASKREHAAPVSLAAGQESSLGQAGVSPASSCSIAARWRRWWTD